MHGIQKDDTDEPRCKKRNEDTDVENGLMDTAGEGESGTNWEKLSTYIHIYTYVKQRASRKLLYSTWSPGLVLCDDLEGWDVGERGWEGESRGGDMIEIEIYD